MDERLIALFERFVAAHEKIADELEIIRYIAAEESAGTQNGEWQATAHEYGGSNDH